MAARRSTYSSEASRYIYRLTKNSLPHTKSLSPLLFLFQCRHSYYTASLGNSLIDLFSTIQGHHWYNTEQCYQLRSPAGSAVKVSRSNESPNSTHHMLLQILGVGYGLLRHHNCIPTSAQKFGLLPAHDLPDPLSRLSSPFPLCSTHKLHCRASERARERESLGMRLGLDYGECFSSLDRLYPEL